MNKGLFVVFEGLDLTGKSTIVRELKKIKPHYIYTREPGGNNCTLAEKIRSLILTYPNEMDALTEAYLFAASRNEHVNEIKKWLENEEVVICDRFVYSSFFYQGCIKKLKTKTIKNINKYILRNIEPDLIFYVTVSDSEREKRARSRTELNKLDEKSLSIDYRAANEEYYKIIKKYSKSKIIVIDTTDNNINKYMKTILNEILIFKE